jgi:hypothetical protein
VKFNSCKSIHSKAKPLEINICWKGYYKMKKNSIKLFLAVIVLVLASIACGSSTAGGEVVSTVASGSQPTSGSSQVQTHNIGDVIQAGTINVTMNSASISGGVLTANFTVENKGTESITVSSLMSFEAKADDGTKLEVDIFDCTSGSLDGTVLANDKLKGNICWKGVTTSAAKIYFTPELFGGTVIVWEVK